jgi:hypothetical protein
VKSGIRMRGILLWVFVSLIACASGVAGDKKEKAPPAKYVESGSFGIFVRGQRVLTESFSIEQKDGDSVIKSQLKETTQSDAGSQKCDLELNSKGELLRYEWSQSTGASLSVFPDNEFLKERITASAGAKAAEQAFLLPSVTPILDNNFFIHRQLLAWKYLLTALCKDENGQRKCQPADFGTLVPQERLSMSVRMELVGKEKVSIRGADRELLRLNLHGENFDWSLWLDESDHFKLMRVSIPADSTEVVRD